MTDHTKTPEQLNHSRQLDVHVWSDFPEINQFIDQIHDLHFTDSLTRIRKHHLKVVLLDLYVAWLTDPELCITVHMGNSRYVGKSR